MTPLVEYASEPRPSLKMINSESKIGYFDIKSKPESTGFQTDLKSKVLKKIFFFFFFFFFQFFCIEKKYLKKIFFFFFFFYQFLGIERKSLKPSFFAASIILPCL